MKPEAFIREANDLFLDHITPRCCGFFASGGEPIAVETLQFIKRLNKDHLSTLEKTVWDQTDSVVDVTIKTFIAEQRRHAVNHPPIQGSLNDPLLDDASNALYMFTQLYDRYLPPIMPTKDAAAQTAVPILRATDTAVVDALAIDEKSQEQLPDIVRQLHQMNQALSQGDVSTGAFAVSGHINGQLRSPQLLVDKSLWARNTLRELVNTLANLLRKIVAYVVECTSKVRKQVKKHPIQDGDTRTAAEIFVSFVKKSSDNPADYFNYAIYRRTGRLATGKDTPFHVLKVLRSLDVTVLLQTDTLLSEETTASAQQAMALLVGNKKAYEIAFNKLLTAISSFIETVRTNGYLADVEDHNSGIFKQMAVYHFLMQPMPTSMYRDKYLPTLQSLAEEIDFPLQENLDTEREALWQYVNARQLLMREAPANKQQAAPLPAPNTLSNDGVGLSVMSH